MQIVGAKFSDALVPRAAHAYETAHSFALPTNSFARRGAKWSPRLDGLNFHDLRDGSLALEGSQPSEIASVTAHRLQDLCNILDRYYLGEREMAVDLLLSWQP
jgi:hypothetical protein